MPLYEYECNACGDRAEKITSVKNADRSRPCHACHVGFLRRVMSTPNFRVTGFNEKNGYNLPKKSDVLNSDGTATKAFGGKY